MKTNPALPLVKEVKEIRVCTMDDLKEMAAMLTTGKWIAIAATRSPDGDQYVIAMGRTVD